MDVLLGKMGKADYTFLREETQEGERASQSYSG
jgi:hypothetical protein